MTCPICATPLTLPHEAGTGLAHTSDRCAAADAARGSVAAERERIALGDERDAAAYDTDPATALVAKVLRERAERVRAGR